MKPLLHVAPRLLLALVGVVLVAVAVRLGLNPQASGLDASTPAALSSVRVLYGGFHGGLGLFALACALRSARVSAGLWAAGATSVAVIGFRTLGVALDGPTAENILLLQRESASALLIALAIVLRSIARARVQADAQG